MSVDIFYEDTKILDFDPEFFVSWLDKVCRTEQKILGEVSIIVCSDSYLLDVNRRYLNHDYYTDIITFDYSEDNFISGDLFISIDRVLENAESHNVSRETEFHRVVVHGVLHLIGFNDKSDEEQILMREKEGYYLGFT